MKLWLYLKLQGYFGYENDRTHVIKVVVLVVKITIQLTYDIHGFKKKEHTTTRLFNGDASTCRKQITMNRMPCLRDVGPYNICLAP